jgi:type IV pilus assembly protein PilB
MTMNPTRLRLGDMLVAAGIVGESQVGEALERQKGSGRRLGEVLVELGYVTEHQLAQVLSNQLSIPWVNLHHVDFSRELLNLLSADLAEKAVVVPVYVRHVRKQGDTLFVATADPLNDGALAQIAAQVGMPVKPMVAGATDVRNAIRAYYGREVVGPAPREDKKKALIASIPPVELSEVEIEVSDVEASAPKEVPAAPTTTAPTIATTAAPTAVVRPAEETPAPAAVSAPEPTAAADEPAPRRRQKKPAAKMITLSFLDGSTVRLPAPGAEPSEEHEEQLTTRDLIAALRARAQGKDVSDVLPDGHWESMFAALLSLLLRKGLVADWEFVEEWNKHRARKS